MPKTFNGAGQAVKVFFYGAGHFAPDRHILVLSKAKSFEDSW